MSSATGQSLGELAWTLVEVVGPVFGLVVVVSAFASWSFERLGLRDPTALLAIRWLVVGLSLALLAERLESRVVGYAQSSWSQLSNRSAGARSGSRGHR